MLFRNFYLIWRYTYCLKVRVRSLSTSNCSIQYHSWLLHLDNTYCIKQAIAVLWKWLISGLYNLYETLPLLVFITSRVFRDLGKLLTNDVMPWGRLGCVHHTPYWPWGCRYIDKTRRTFEISISPAWDNPCTYFIVFTTYLIFVSFEKLTHTVLTWLNVAATITLVSKIGAATIQTWLPFDTRKTIFISHYIHNRLWAPLSAVTNRGVASNQVNMVVLVGLDQGPVEYSFETSLSLWQWLHTPAASSVCLEENRYKRILHNRLSKAVKSLQNSLILSVVSGWSTVRLVQVLVQAYL